MIVVYQIYEMMHLNVLVRRDGTLIADPGCNALPLPSGSFHITTQAFVFCALLSWDAHSPLSPPKARRQHEL
jgi:hypothetical protein